jgi:hypothetical protein
MQANQGSSTSSYASMAVCLQAVWICCRNQMLHLYLSQLTVKYSQPLLDSFDRHGLLATNSTSSTVFKGNPLLTAAQSEQVRRSLARKATRSAQQLSPAKAVLPRSYRSAETLSARFKANTRLPCSQQLVYAALSFPALACKLTVA